MTTQNSRDNYPDRTRRYDDVQNENGGPEHWDPVTDTVTSPYRDSTHSNDKIGKGVDKSKAPKSAALPILITVLQCVSFAFSMIFLVIGLFKLNEYKPTTVTPKQAETGDEVDTPPKGFLIASLALMVIFVVFKMAKTGMAFAQKKKPT